jgi:hypothetical protein
MLRLEPMAMDGVLPAVVVGFEVAGDDLQRAAALPDPPDGVMLLDQQAGGLAMSYPSVLGVVLPLAANVGRAGPRAADVIRGLLAMQEDPDLAALEREFPALRAMVLSQGDPYTRGDLDRLHAFVGRAFRLPVFESGLEAFVRCAPADPLAYLRGWQSFSCTPRPDSGLSVLDAYGLRAYRAELVVDDTRLFDETLLDAVCTTGARVATHGAPRLFLLWTNSD